MKKGTKIIYVGDQDYDNEFIYEHVNVLSSYRSVFDLSQKIISIESDALVISIHYRYSENIENGEEYLFLQDMAGIDLLKVLRINGYDKHCFLHTPLSYEEIIRKNPDNIIILSPGVSIINGFKEIDFNVCESRLIDAKSEGIAKYISSYSLNQDRHDFANWWGVIRLYEMHNLVKTSLSDKVIKDQYLLSGINDIKKSIRGQMAFFQYGTKKDILLDKIDKLYQIRDNCIKENRIYYKIISDIKKIYDDNVLEKFIIDHKDEIKKITSKGLKDYNIESLKLCDIDLLVYDIEQEIIANKHLVEYYDISKKLQKIKDNNPNILYIDDQAYMGWGDLFQYIIYGNKSDRFVIIDPPKSNQSDKHYYLNNVKQTIADNNTDLILLDLRLRKLYDENKSIENVSGYNILSFIRSDYLAIPIIIITASNKVKTYEELFRVGCDAFWVKEGVSLDKNTDETIHNYLKFIDLIEKGTSEKFQKTKEYGEKIKVILKTEIKYWWEEMNSLAGKRHVEKTKIVAILQDGLRLLQDYLSSIELKKVFFINRNQWFYASLIILHLAKILEIIHDTVNDRGIPSQYGVAKRLYKVRNKAAHMLPYQAYNGKYTDCVTDIDINTAFDFMDQLMDKYLLSDKQKNGLKIVGKINL